MLKQRQASAGDAAQMALHGQVERRIVVLHRGEQAAHLNLGGQLLAYLALEGVLRLLAGLNLAAGKLPPIFPFAIAALRGQHFCAVDDYGRNYVYCLHVCIFLHRVHESGQNGVVHLPVYLHRLVVFGAYVVHQAEAHKRHCVAIAVLFVLAHK